MLSVIRVISIAGLLIFGPALFIAIVAPDLVESAAKSFVITKAKEGVDRHLETPAGRKLKETYGLLRDRYAQRIEQAEADLNEDLPERIADILGKLCHFDCETRERLKTALVEGLKARIGTLNTALETIKTLAQRKYSEVTRNIRRDLTVFGGSNVAIFAILLALTFSRREDARALALPASLMLVSTVCAITIYVFGQDWFYAILTNSYMGFGYLSYVVVIFLFLADIVYRQGETTLSILAGITRGLNSCGIPV